MEAVCRLWAAECVYVLPGRPVMHSLPAIRATIVEVWNAVHAQAEGADVISGFDLTCLVDPAAGEQPLMVTAYGGHSLTVGSRPTQHVQGTAIGQCIDGQWKLRLVTVVRASDEILDVIKPGSAK